MAWPDAASIGFGRMMAVTPLASMAPALVPFVSAAAASVELEVNVDGYRCCSGAPFLLDNVVSAVAAAVDKSDPALTNAELDWVTLEMIMSLRLPPVATRVDGASAVGCAGCI